MAPSALPKIVVIITSLIMVAISIFLLYKSLMNRINIFDIAEGVKIRSFTTTVDPTTSGQLNGGNPVLTCPAGKQINLIAAFTSIDDAYNACTVDSSGASQVSDLLQLQCDPDAISEYTVDSAGECPNAGLGFEIATQNGHCRLQPVDQKQYPNAIPLLYTPDLTKPGQRKAGYFLVNPDMCGYSIAQLNNPTPAAYDPQTLYPLASCKPDGGNWSAGIDNGCATRDVTAEIYNDVSGKQTATVLASSLLEGENNWAPCTRYIPGKCLSQLSINGQGPSIFDSRTGYCNLPFTPGFAGGAPPNSAGGSTADPTFNLGYKVHGIYTCVDPPK